MLEALRVTLVRTVQLVQLVGRELRVGEVLTVLLVTLVLRVHQEGLVKLVCEVRR